MPHTRTAPILGIDSHAHVFSRDLQLTSARRYTPDYDATLALYLANLARHGLSHGVLVQPSFLGTDNSYLLAALAQAPEQLRGVVVVARDISRAELQAMATQGVTGIRLNLMGKPLPDFTEPEWQVLFGHIAELDWHIELHRQVEDLPQLVRALLPFGCKIVVDHFGRPDARLGVNQPGFIELLDLGTTGQLWMKVSAIYRLAGDARQNLEFACSVLPLLEQSLGPQRLVWGSDWPHTQHERDVGYGAVMEQLRALGCSESLRQAMLVDSPAQLFRFVLPENT
jgi:predicted TIM-barrel fold metal-dependent hydrolase